MKKQLLITVFAGGLMLALPACSSGHRVDYNKVGTIQKNITTENDIREMFGQPTATQMNLQQGTKILTYDYNKNNSFAQSAASTTGALAGGILASKNIGKGTGRYVSGTLGALFGGYLGKQATQVNRESQTLNVVINTATNRVIDYNYVTRQQRR